MAEFSNRPRPVPVTQMPQFPSTAALSDLYLKEGDIQAQSVRDIGEIQARTAQNVGTGISEGLGAAIQHYQEAPQREAEAAAKAADEERKRLDAEWEKNKRTYEMEVERPHKALQREEEILGFGEAVKQRERDAYTHTETIREDFREINDQYRAELGAAARNVLSSETFTVPQLEALKQHMDLADIESEGFFPCIESGDPTCKNLRNEIADLVRFSEEKVDPADLHRYRQNDFDPVSTSAAGAGVGGDRLPSTADQFREVMIAFTTEEAALAHFPENPPEVGMPIPAVYNLNEGGFQTKVGGPVISPTDDVKIIPASETEDQIRGDRGIARSVALGDALLKEVTTTRGRQRSRVATMANELRHEWGLPDIDFLNMEVNQKATMTWAQSMNSFPKLKWVSLARSVRETMTVARELAEKLKQGGLRPWNQAMRTLEKQTNLGVWNPEMGVLSGEAPEQIYSLLAAQYDAVVITLIELYANLMSGANAPTNQAFELAIESLDPNMSYRDMEGVLEILYREIAIREMSLRSQTPTLIDLDKAVAADMGSPALATTLNQADSVVYDDFGANTGEYMYDVGDKAYFSPAALRKEITKTLAGNPDVTPEQWERINTIDKGHFMELVETKDGGRHWKDADMSEKAPYDPNSRLMFQMQSNRPDIQGLTDALDFLTAPVRVAATPE